MRYLLKSGLIKAILLSGTGLSLALSSVTAQSAELVLQNGNIYTPDGWVTAMGVDSGVIVTLGSDDDLQDEVEDSTRVVDLEGATVLPGLFDNHIHPIGAGLSQQECRIPQGSPLAEVRGILTECVANADPGEWIQGGSYETATLGVQPTKEILDEVAPDNPVAFTDISYHSRWVNSAALEAAGITAETEDPENGTIVRDENGEPTGVLHERATGLVSSVIPGPTAEDNLEALRWMQREALSYGLIGWEDAGVSMSSAEAYAQLADEGNLVMRIRGCIRAEGEELIERRALFERDRFSPSCIKSIIDGVPTDSNTAAMLDPYAASAAPGEPGPGETMMTQQELTDLVTRFDDMGMTVKVHAAGDAGVRAVIRAISATREANGFSGLHHNVAHASFVHPDDIQAAVEANATIEFSPYIWFDNPIVQGISQAIGPERMERWIPIADALEAGVESVPGSDYSVVPSVNPWIAIETMVTRQRPGGSDEQIGASQKITLEQAMDMFTIESAQYRGLEHLTGSLEPGKFADFIVVDQNIFEVDPTKIHDTQVLHTYIEGEEVYTSEAK